MSEELSIKHQSLLYQAQKNILAHGKDVKAILEVLGQLSKDLFNQEEFAVLSYDFAAQMTRPIHKQGFKEETLNRLAEDFTKLKVEKKPIVRSQIVDEEVGKINLVPIGDEDDIYGQIVFVESAQTDKATVNEFVEVATTSLGIFLGVGLLQLHLEEMAALIEVSHVVSSTLDLRELLTKIMKTATKVMRCETSTVYLVDEATNELYFSIVQGDSKVGAKLKEIRLPMGTGLAGWCAQNNAPVMVPDTDKDPRFFKGADKKSGFVTRSMICVPMCLKEKVIGVLQVLNRTGDIPFNDHDLETLKAVATQAVSAIENARLYENIQKIYLSTIEVLATAIDAKDPYTRGHSRRVTLYSVAIAEQLGLSPKEIENIRYAGLLHDVGKIGISDSIIRKPGRLTDEEYGIIKTHPAIGARILRPVEFLADKIPGVLHHHEYYDGRGYPDHLVGEDIPLAGRIICVADCFDAMTTNRPYRKGLSVNTVIAELNKLSGKQFDPVCVEAFLSAFEAKISQYFEPIEGSTDNDMALKPEEMGTTEEPEKIQKDKQPYPPISCDSDKKKQESQPYPPIKCDSDKKEEKKLESQPYPPINCDSDKKEEKKLESQPYPPINCDSDKKEEKKLESQPYPPINCDSDKKDNK